MRAGLAALLWVGLSAWALADPAAPSHASYIDHLEVGIFCTPRDMGQAPAPGTQSGKVHVPHDMIAFDWPGQQIVPAEIGLSFGVKAELSPGFAVPFGEIRVYVPGREAPEIWGSSFSDFGPTLSFFSFDREEELLPGLWRLEAWDGAERLYSVTFEVVPAASISRISGACGAVS